MSYDVLVLYCTNEFIVSRVAIFNIYTRSKL